MSDKLRRIIIDVKKLTPDLLALLVKKYPDGYDDDHIITFKNAKDHIIEAVEVCTENTKYLVKVSSTLAVTMAKYDENGDPKFNINTPKQAS